MALNPTQTHVKERRERAIVYPPTLAGQRPPLWLSGKITMVLTHFKSQDAA